MQTIDSLHHQLSFARNDTSRINTLIELCLQYRLGNVDSCLLYGQQALESAQKINYHQGKILALSFMSVAMEQMGNLPGSLEMAFRAIQIAKENHIELFAAPAYNAIGETYIILKDYTNALKFLRQQKSVCEATGITEGLAYALFDIGVVFEEMNQPDSAFYYEQKAIEFFKKTYREEPLVYNTLGNIEMKSGNQTAALNYYQTGLRLSVKNNERRAIAYAYNKLAEFYKKINQPDSAIYYAGKGLNESTSISQKKTLQEAAALLAELFEQKDTKESLRYLKIANAYKDSLFGAANLQAIQALANQQEEHQKEIAASRLKYQNNLKQYALFAALGILLLIAFNLYRNNRQKQKANKVLENTLDNLKSTQTQLIQSEKMASLGELTAGIAHEIQNPVNFVNNFSEVNNELIEEIKNQKSNPDSYREKNEELDEILDDIFQNNEKINHHGKRADAIVKSMLQHSRASSGQRELTNINELADEYLRLAYHGLRAKDKSFNAEFETDFDKDLSSVGGEINIIPQDIGRVLLNLFTNAFYSVTEKHKHYPENYQPAVSVSTKKIDGNVRIAVRDNGMGVPKNVMDKIFQPFFTTKPTGQGTGLGLSLSYDIITRGHGGELKVETKEGEYAEFIIYLPNKS